jgi:Zn-dependent protease with chaperone function
MDRLDALTATDVISAMRLESRLRTGLLMLIVAILPSAWFASAFPDQLSDLLLPIGPPLTHVANALLVFIGMFALMLVTTRELDRRKVWPPGKAPSLGTTVPRLVEQLAGALGIAVEVQSYGGLTEGEIESVIIGSRNIIRIATSRLRQSKTNPDAFRYIVAHELIHLAAGDPRTDRRIMCCYSVGAFFMLVGFGGVLWSVGGVVATSASFGLEGIIVGLKTIWLPLLTNTASMGALAALLYLETRSAMRLREFHADVVASALVGPQRAVFTSLERVRAGWVERVMHLLLSNHPEGGVRRLALGDQSAAFRADQPYFVLQGFFAATVTEILLQMLFVNASPDVSTLVERRQYLSESLNMYPRAIPLVIAVAALLGIASQVLVFRRLRATIVADRGAHSLSRLALRVPVSVAAGACLALACSQTFIWELSQYSWRLDSWLVSDPDRASIYAASLTGTIIAILAMLADNGRWSLTKQGTVTLSALPVLCSLAVGYAFYR